MGLANSIITKHPDLKRKLYMAGIDKLPEEYVKLKLKNAFLFGITFLILSFFIIDKQDGNLLFCPIVAIITFVISLNVGLKEVDAKINKRAKVIDKDVLFAGRFLLVKLNSGKPLVGALEDASKSYGISNEYFKGIIKDIDLGTPLEKALEKATVNSPSKRMKKILFQITNALRIGTDVTNFLDAILDEIADEQLIEIQRYGKKLNGLTMFYMLLAIVMPSLGMTMLVVIASLISFNISLTAFLAIIIFLIIFQFIFLTLFKSIRPNVHI